MPVASELLVKIGADTKDLESGLSRADSKVSGFAKGASALGAVGTAAFVGLGAAALGMGAGFAASVSSASSFQATLSQVGAVSGATGTQLNDLSALALKMGADTSFSAGEAAQAMSELAKGGIEVGAMASVLPGTLDLAAAGGIGLAQAATIATDAMSIFGAQGVTMDRVANAFAGAANISSISVDDMAQSMTYVGPVAAAMGLSLEDTSAAIALLGANGLKGSMAGTGLRTMLTSLASPSKEAAGLMQSLGLNVFDANGKMKDFTGISDSLKTALAGMSDQQRLATLETLFGREGMSAAIAMMGTGENSIQSYTQKLAAATTAHETGKKMLDNFKGSMEQLKGSVETAAITLGLAFLPVLRQLVDAATAGVNAALPFIQTWGPRLAAGLQQGIAAAMAFGPGFVAALQSGFAQAVAVVQTTIAAIMATFAALRTGDFSNLFGPLIVAIDTAFGPQTAGKVTLFVSSLVTGLNLARDAVITAKQAFAGDWISADSIAAPVRLVGEAFTLFGNAARALADPMAFLRVQLFNLSTAFPQFSGPILALIPLLDRFGPTIAVAAAAFVAFGPAVRLVALALPLLVGAFTGLGPIISILTSTLPLLGAVIAAIGLPITLLIAAVAALGIAWATNFMGIQQAVAGPVAAVTALLGTLGAYLTGTLLPQLATLGPIFQAAFSSILPAIQAFGTAFMGLVAIVAPLLTQIGGLIVSSLGPAIAAFVNFEAVVIPQFAAAFANILAIVTPILIGLGALITANMTTIQTVISSVWAIITGIITVAWTTITTIISAALQLIAGDSDAAWATIVAGATSVWATLGGVVQAAWDGITAIVGAAASALAPLVGAAFDALGTAVRGSLDAVGSAIGDSFSAMGTTVRDKLTEINNGVGDAFSGLGSTIQDALSSVGSAVGDTFSNLGSLVQGGLDAIGSAVGDTFSALGGTVQGALDAVRGIIADVWNAIPEDIRADLEAISANIGERFSSFGSTISSAMSDIQSTITSDWDSITTAVSGAIDTLSSAISTAWDGISTVVSTAMTTVQTTVTTAWDSISTVISTAMTTVQTTVTSAWDGVSSAVQTATAKIYGYVTSAWDTVSTSTQQAWSSFSSTITTWINSAVTTVQGFAGKVSSALSGVAGTARSEAAAIGQAIIDGVKGAIDAGARALASSAAAAVRGALDAAKGALGIQSPSKEFAYLGEMSVAGLVKGMSDNEQKAAKAGADLVSALSKAVHDGLGALKALSLFNPATMAPTDAQRGGFLAALAPLLADLNAATTAYSEESAKAATRWADVSGKLLGVVKTGLDALAGLVTFVAPAQANIAAFKFATQSLVTSLGDSAAVMDADFVANAAVWAEGAGKSLAILKTGADGLRALLDFVAPTQANIAAFKFATESLVQSLGDSAVVMDATFSANAGIWATGTGKALGILKAGVDGFAALATLVVPSQAAIAAFKFATEALVTSLGDSAATMTGAFLTHATAYAETAGKGLGIIANGVAGLAALKNFAVPLEDDMSNFAYAVERFLIELTGSATIFTAAFLTHASAYADTAGKGLAIIGNGVAGLNALKGFTVPLEDDMSNFASGVERFIIQLTGSATFFTAEFLKQATAYADGAGKALAVIGSGVTGLMQLATFVAPSQAAIDNFAYAVGHLVERFANAAQMIGTEGVAAAGAFGTAAKLAVDTIKTGLDAFANFKSMSIPSSDAIDTLVAGVTYVVQRFADMADQMGKGALGKAQDFATAVGASAKSVQTAIGTFKSLTEAPFKGAMTAIMVEFARDFDGSLTLMKDATAAAGEYEAQAHLYEQAMKNAASWIAAGNAALATAALPGNGMGAAMADAGAHLGNSLADGMRGALEIHSPSAVTARIGAEVVAGLVNGITAGKPELVKAAAEAASAVATALGGMADALAKVGQFGGIELPTLYAFGKGLRAAIDDFALIAEQVGVKGAAAAGLFAEGAGKVVAAIGTGADAFAKLAGFVAPPVAALYAFGRTLRAAVADFSLIAEQVTVEAATQAGLFADGAGKVVAIIASGVAGFAALAGFAAPLDAEMGAFIGAIFTFTATFARWVPSLASGQLAAATLFAETAGKVTGIIGTGVQGFTALAGFTAPLPQVMGSFIDSLITFGATFANWVPHYATEQLAAAVAFAEATGKVLAIVANGVAGFAALSGFVAPTAAEIGAFVGSMITLGATFVNWVPRYAADFLTSAGQFAETTGKVLAIVANGVAGFGALRGFVAPAAAELGSFVGALITFGATFVNWVPHYAAEQLTAASLFADTAGKVVGIIGAGVDGFGKLADFRAPLDGTMGGFLATLIDFTARFAAAVPRFASEQLAAASAFADVASKAVGLIGTGVAGFAALADFRAPTAAALDAFAWSVGQLVTRMVGIGAWFEQNGLDAAGTFADTAGKVLATLGQGVSGLTSLFTFVAPGLGALDAFAGAVRDMVARFAWIAGTLSGDGVKAAAEFGAATGTIFGALQSATGFFNSLDGLLLPDRAGIDRLLAPIIDTLAAVTDAANRIGAGGLEAATAFSTAVGAVFGAINTAQQATGGIAPLAIGGGGGSGGGGGGITVVFNQSAPIYGVADLQEAVVGAVIEARRRGRL